MGAELVVGVADPDLVPRDLGSTLLLRALHDAGAMGKDPYPLSGSVDGIMASAHIIDGFAFKAQRAVRLVGPNIVALAAGANRAYALEWSAGENRPATSTVRRVCLVSTVSDYLAESFKARGLLIDEDPVVDIQAFFMGMPAQLDERSPVEVIRTLPFRQAATLVCSAALSFAD